MTRTAEVTVAVTAVAIALSASPTRAAVRPNVVLRMANDLGFNDLSRYGCKRMRTPELDKLVGKGVRLTSFYSGSTGCTPSRMAILTGVYATCGLAGGVVGYKINGGRGLVRNP